MQDQVCPPPTVPSRGAGCLRSRDRTGSSTRMNRCHRTDDVHGLARRYLQGMQAVRRLVAGDPGVIVDAAIGIVAAGLTAVAAWGPPGLIGTTIAGPSW